MNGIPFQLVLKTPVRLGAGSTIHCLNNGQLLISAARVRGTMRQYLRELFTRQGVGSELEVQIFGEVTTKRAIRSKFSLSSLLSAIDQYQDGVVPPNTSFNDKFFSVVPSKSTADFAIRLALLGVHNLHKGGGVNCEINFSDNSRLSDSFYQQKLLTDEDKKKTYKSL